MINILSYIGMTLQSEVCLWTLLGLLRTIFDATLFKVNANLKQVWQMQMPVELSLPVQRVLRTMISGVMLVQCFTVYVYLASYIVLLYPVFLEERPTLVLPWLLLAAIRNLLCELTSLALGLGTCVLLGPARPPCIKFVILKLVSIMPAFYTWLLIFSYYHRLKVASAFKTFPAVSPSKDLDYGLELAVRRRRTKTLLGEDQVRKKLMDSLYENEKPDSVKSELKSWEQVNEANSFSVLAFGSFIKEFLILLSYIITFKHISCRYCEHNESQQLVNIDETYKSSSNSSNEDIIQPGTEIYPLPVVSNRTMSDIGRYEDWFGSEVVVPRDTDRILEQIVLMLLRIGVFLGKESTDTVKFLSSSSQVYLPSARKVECISTEVAETPPLVASSKGRMASYLRDYPQIFMKKASGLLGTLNSPIRIHENNSIVEKSQSIHSLETTEISLGSVSSMCENKDFLPTNDIESPNKTLTDAHEDVNKYGAENQIENISHPLEAKEILESVSSMCENKKILRTINEMKSPSKTLTDTQEDVNKYVTDEQAENNIDQTSKETKSLNAKSSESIESIINRMKIRAACMDMPSSTLNNRSSTSSVNTESSKNSNKSKPTKSKTHKHK